MNYISNLSSYLHFGHTSPLRYPASIRNRKPGADSYLEELIVRRELDMNFVYYNPNYDKFNSIPKWAHDTLLKHQSDRREHIYSWKELEIAETRDAYWNACQKEMVHKGEMHGYLATV
jgi:deoxyribodipyrimidine photo-lyase